jgi:2-polyprenyl-3-methyl-5-hydroxy-6-metoxy-1,4-benzoquinol methylase
MAGRNRWEEFAREAPEEYILTGPRVATSSDAERRRGFFASGEQSVAEVLDRAGRYGHGWGCALDIGCGIGRLSLPLARRFSEVRSVDVAPTMLSLLQSNAGEAGLANIQTYLPDGTWDTPATVDYVLCFIVFQHIESWPVICDYLERIGRALRPHGIAHLQFDTRPRSLPYFARNLLPDVVLPRPQRRGIRRIRRTPAELARLFRASHLEVAEEWGQDSGFHTFLVRSASAC